MYTLHFNTYFEISGKQYLVLDDALQQSVSNTFSTTVLETTSVILRGVSKICNTLVCRYWIFTAERNTGVLILDIIGLYNGYILVNPGISLQLDSRGAKGSNCTASMARFQYH